MVISKSDNENGYLVCLNCETDFVAKNDDFGAFANSLIDLAIKSESNTVEDLLNQKYADSELTVKKKLLSRVV